MKILVGDMEDLEEPQVCLEPKKGLPSSPMKILVGDTEDQKVPQVHLEPKKGLPLLVEDLAYLELEN